MTADVSLSRVEFIGNCWECGWTAGWAGDDLPRFLADLARTLERPLTEWEAERVTDGWHEGLTDRVQYARDRAAADERAAASDEAVPF